MSKTLELERDYLPQGAGCFTCSGTGYVEDERYALDRNGCPDCQELVYRIVPDDDARYFGEEWAYFATLREAKAARKGRDYIEHRLPGTDGSEDEHWERVR